MKFGLLCLLILSLAGCSWQRREDEVHGTVRVQLPFAINGKYGLYVLDLTSLMNLGNLEGSAAQFLMNPGVQNGRLTGSAPSIRYIRNTDGVIVPKDDLSLQLLTVYAHVERLQALDNQVGAQGVLRYPRTVAVNAQYRTSDGELENNALYSGTYDSLLVVPYTQQALPIMANGGILGHEHFHALFYHLVIGPLGKIYPDYQEPTPHSSGRLEKLVGLTQVDRKSGVLLENKALSAAEVRARYHSMVMRGLNEGLADVWGWIYSGDSIFVGQSLPQEKMNRNLDSPAEVLNSRLMLQHWISQVVRGKDLLSMSYNLGSQVARALRSFAPILAGKNVDPASLGQNRIEMGKILLKTLPELKKKFASLKEDEFLDPSTILQLFAEQVPALSSEGCGHLLNLMPLQEQTESFKDRCSTLGKAALEDREKDEETIIVDPVTP